MSGLFESPKATYETPEKLPGLMGLGQQMIQRLGSILSGQMQPQPYRGYQSIQNPTSYAFNPSFQQPPSVMQQIMQMIPGWYNKTNQDKDLNSPERYAADRYLPERYRALTRGDTYEGTFESATPATGQHSGATAGGIGDVDSIVKDIMDQVGTGTEEHTLSGEY